jgi:SAM-dependent methyltransferase
MDGILGDDFLRIAGLLDAWAWWPPSLEGRTAVDVGCFTGGLSLLLASRAAARVVAVDEIPEHLAQCQFLAQTFQVPAVECVASSLYELPRSIEVGSVDLVLLSGVLYHLSDMLAGLVVVRRLLRPGGTLLIESNAIECFQHSYANFGRFFAGMWWQPTALCILDLLEFTGFSDTEARFYRENRCLVRARRSEEKDIPFRRGMNLSFDDIHDARPRPLDPAVMAPRPCRHD